MKWNELTEQDCPIARAMAVVGDRWTLMILRDCLMGIRRFDQFQDSLGITRHLLSERLKKLESLGLLRRQPCPIAIAAGAIHRRSRHRHLKKITP